MGSVASQELKTFRNNGLLSLPSAIGKEVIDRVQIQLWSEIESRFGIVKSTPSTWRGNGTSSKRLGGMNPIMRKLKDSGTLDDIESATINTINNVFCKNSWNPLPMWYSLLSFPGTETTWNVPNSSWHADEPTIQGEHEAFSFFAFVFLDTVTIDMGPTLVVSGSHRRAQYLVDKEGAPNPSLIKAFDTNPSPLIKRPEVAKLLAPSELMKLLSNKDSWFKELGSDGPPEQRINSFMKQGTNVNDIQSKVVELTGNAGDIIILDPRCLHSISSNISKLPREVLRLDFRRDS